MNYERNLMNKSGSKKTGKNFVSTLFKKGKYNEDKRKNNSN